MEAILHDDLENAEYEIDCAEVFKERMMTFLKKRIDKVPDYMIKDKEEVLGQLKDVLDDAFYEYVQEQESIAEPLAFQLQTEWENSERTY